MVPIYIKQPLGADDEACLYTRDVFYCALYEAQERKTTGS